MRRDRALDVLRGLQVEAEDFGVIAGGEALVEWKAKVRGTLAASLGPSDHIVQKFDAMKFSYTGPAWSGMDRTVYTTPVDRAVHRI